MKVLKMSIGWLSVFASLITAPVAFSGVPAIFGVNPVSGPTGTLVTIGGTNFATTPLGNIVYFGPVRATVNSASATSLTVSVPSGAMLAPITVTANGLSAYSDIFFQPTFLGNGSSLSLSNFASRIDIGTGSGPCRIAVADFDGDGKPDLAVANAYDHTIEIYQNISSNGTLSAGSFAAPVVIPFVSSSNPDPYWLAAADVDGDGKIDLIVPDEASNQVIIYRNISSGGVLTSSSFAAPVGFNVGSTPRQVVVGDLDGDGRPDIVAANIGDGTISILRNIGSAGTIDSNSFAPQIVLVAGSQPHDLAIGDLDGDGKPDLVVNNYESPFVSIFRNVSVPGTLNTNSFETRLDLPAPLYCSSVALGDLDGDGRLDIVFSASDNSDVISVYDNLSTPGALTTNSFAPRLDFPALGWVDGVTLGDLAGDGKPDIALVNQLSDSMSLFQNIGTGSFTSASLGPRLDFSSGSNPYGVQIVDLDGDGRPDIVFVNTYSDTLSIYQNITPSLPQITSQPADEAVAVGGTASFSITASGAPPFEYQWYNSSGSIPGATNSTLTLNNVQLSAAGSYYVTVVNPYGSTNSASATLTVTNASGSCTPLPSGIVAWWRAEDNTDDSINGNDGTFQGNPSYTNGEVGQAFNFDGASYVLVPASTTLDFTNVMTVEAWVNLTSFSGANDREIISKYGATGSDDVFTLSIDPTTHQAYFHINSTNGATNLRINSSTTISLNEWTHIAATVDGNNLNLYVNGALSATLPWTQGILAVTEPLSIGCTLSTGGPTSYFNGQVDEVSLYNQALSASEIADIYNAGSAGKCGGELAPTITAQPTNETVGVGGTANFSVTVSGSSPFEYQWFNGSGNIINATNSTLTLSNVQLSAAGSYYVTVVNPYGSTNSSSATLTVTNPAPPVTAPPVITGFSPASGTTGAEVTITGTNFNATASGNIVYFGAVQAEVVSASATQLMVTVPVGATFAPISVTVDGLTAYSDQPFMPIFPGDGVLSNSSFATAFNLNTESGPNQVVIADIDGDGKPDVVVGNFNAGVVSIFRNISSNGVLNAAAFAAPVNLVVGPANVDLWTIAVADLDGDGRLDIVALNTASNIVSIFRNISSPGVLSSNSFAARIDLPGGDVMRGVAVQDLDGDGRPEIVVGNFGDNDVSVYKNLSTIGNIAFAPRVNFACGNGPLTVVIGDLDGDGFPDIAVADLNSGAVSVLRNQGFTGTITTSSFASAVNFTGPASAQGLALGDIDGDGKLDMVVGGNTYSSTVTVYRNTSTPGSITSNSFAAAVNYPAAGWANAVALADLDGSGKLDIAVVSQENNAFSVFQNLSTPGSITLGPRQDFTAGGNPNSIAIGDLNGDGRPDVVFGNFYDNTLSIYENAVPLADIPPTITAEPANETVETGGTASFSVTASGSSPIEYQWFNGSGSIINATNSTLTLSNVQLSAAGSYYVTVINPYGSTNSSSATLTVTNPPSASCTPPPSGIVAWWRAEDNTLDSVGGNNGTFLGNPSYTNGEVGQAFNFDGASYVEVPASPSLDFTNVMTVEAWVNLTSFEGVNDREILSKYGAAGNQDCFTLSIDPTTQQAYFHVNSSNTTTNLRINSSTTIELNQWTHIAATVDGSNLNLYINGALSATTPWTQGILAVTEPLTIGCTLQAAPTSFFNGEIDEVSLYDRALSASEIAAIYNAGSAGKCFSGMAPTITTQPADQTTDVGGTVHFSVTASGSPTPVYQWFNGSGSIAGATGSTLTLSNVQLSAAGSYYVTVSNPFGSTNSASATLTVTNPLTPTGPPVILGFNPALASPGRAVTINGSNFSATAASNTVYFGAVKAAVTGASASNLTVTLPLGATFAPITETVAGLTADSSNPFLPTFPGDSPLSSSSLGGMFNLALDNGPFGVAIGDLDGDGKPDLVVVNDYAAQIWIYRNIGTNGDLSAASFAPPVILDASSSIAAENIEIVALADLDGDGRLDIVFADHNNSVVSVFQNLCTPGNITTNNFGPRLDFAVGSGPYSVAVADLDGDGKPDLITGNYGDSTISVLRNVSTGGMLTTNSFALPLSFSTPSGPSCVAAGDVDGDGKIDLVTANTGGGVTGVSIFDNTSTPGNISFQRVDLADNQSQDESVAIGDIDGDGKPDLIIGSYTDSSFSVYRNTGTPGNINNSNTFAAPVTFAAGGPIHQGGIALADLDGDGKPDIAAVDQNSGLLYLYRNVSTPGSFTSSSLAAPVTFTGGFNSATVAIGDLDGDGRPDIVIANSYGHNLTLWKNMVPSGPPVIFGASPALGFPGNAVTINGSNFNASAANNIVYFGAVQAKVNSATTSSLTVTFPVGATYAPITETVHGLTADSSNPFLPTFPGSSPLGTSSLSNMFNLPLDNGPFGVAIGDLDGDGKPDLVVVNDYAAQIWIYRNIGTNGDLSAASFAPPVILDAGSPIGAENIEVVTLADLDGDGRLDIVFANHNNSVVSVFQNLCSPGNIATNTFGKRLDFAVGSQPYSVAVADLDGDGQPDLITGNYGDSTISVLRNISTAGLLTTNSFASPLSFSTPSAPSCVAAGDMDGDGKIDLVTANTGGGVTGVSIFDNTSTPGNISFVRVDLADNQSQDESVAIGDIDGDGKPDLIIGSYTDSSFSVYRNTGTPGNINNSNTFAAPVTFAAGGPIHQGGIALADLDGDGKPDIAAVDQNSGLLYLYRNVSTPGSFTGSSLAAPVTFTAGFNSATVAIGDLNGDGRPDIVIANSYGHNLTIWQNVVPTTPGTPPTITLQPVNQNLAVGGTTSFFVGASGSPTLSYQWYHGSISIPGATNPLLVLSNVQPSEAGSYYAIVNNPYGSTNSATANLAVNFPPATLRVENVTAFLPRVSVVVPVDLVANGNENAVSFSLNFDTNRMVFLSALLGTNATGAVLTPNFTQTRNGEIGVKIALANGKTFVAKTNQILQVTFELRSALTSLTTQVSFSSQPVPELLSDINSNSLAINLLNGTITLAPAPTGPAVTSSQPTLTLSYSGNGALLSWPAWAADFNLQAAGNLTPPAIWTNVPVTLQTNGANVEVTVPMTDQQTFFRLSFP